MDTARNPWAPAQRRALTRGALAAGVSTGIALLSHLIAGGAMPALPGIVVPLLLALAVCVLLSGVRMPWVRLLASVGVSQLFFHSLFVLGATDVTHAIGTHAHHASAAPAAAPLMVLAHGLAALLTAALLRHGEVILARIAEAVCRLGWRFRHAVVAVPARPTPAPATLPDDRAWVPVTRMLVLASAVRRGPPATVALHIT